MTRSGRAGGGSRWVRTLVAAWGVPLAGLGLLASRAPDATATSAPNPIVAENALPGTPGWNRALAPTAATTTIDGYTSEIGVTPGQPVHFHITGARGIRYRLEIYRLGWYQGIGGRLQQCVPSCTTDEAVARQPPTPAPGPRNGYLDAGWPVTDVVTLPAGAVSGLYLAKILVTAPSASAGQARNLTFVVREAVPRSPILVQIGVNTEEAYNNWGGKSLYTYNSTGGIAATQVSFNRPDAYNGTWEIRWDYPLIRFLESRGYDISYATDVDTAQGVDEPSLRRLVIVPGHDEYWSKEIRDAFDAAQAAGTSFAFTGANTGYWQMRYGSSDRSIYEYRKAQADPNPDPATKTTEFRQLNPPRPECRLEGDQDLDGIAPTPSNRDYSVVPSALSNPWFTGSGFTPSTVLTDLVGNEWDTANQPGCPHSQILFTWSGTNAYGQPSVADAATFTAPSGARVFAAGSLQYSWGLDGFGRSLASPPLQTFTQNMLDDLSAPRLGPPHLPVLVTDRCRGAAYKPKRINLSCRRGGSFVARLHWRSWTFTKATGAGFISLTSAKRHRQRYAVKVTLSKPGVCPGQSHQLFRHMNLAYNGRRTGQGRPKRVTLRCSS